MNQSEMPTTVESDSLKEDVNKLIPSMMLKANDVKKEITETDNNAPNFQGFLELSLKRKLIDEQSTDDKLQSPSKRIRGNSKDVTEPTEKFQEAIEGDVMISMMDEESIYSLLVSNFPDSWSIQQIFSKRSFEIESVLGNNKNVLRLTFTSAEHKLSAQNTLQNKEVNGSQLCVVEEGAGKDDSDSVTTDIIPSLAPDIWELDPKGLYGLKEDFLSTLNITPPIGNWVHVTNFRCDKSEMKDAFELAGNVVACSIVNTKDKYAKVMYSHPLEAVQAVSMLNNQIFYGKKLNVVMDKNINSEILLPKGLTSIGPGLGEDGSAVREITREYERFLNGKSTKINLSLFTAGNVNGIVIAQKVNYVAIGADKSQTNPQPVTSPEVAKSIPTPTSVRPSPPIRIDLKSNFGANMGPHGPPQIFRSPIPRGPLLGQMVEICSPGQFHHGFPAGSESQMPVPFDPRLSSSVTIHPSGPIHPPRLTHPAGPITPVRLIHSHVPMNAPVPGSSPNWHNSLPAVHTPQMSKCIDSNTLKICNLPPTTSFPSLCGKLSTLAQVTSLEFTTPGCAVVKFVSPSDAEKCFQNYRNIELS